MKYPTEITIRGYTYQIEYVEHGREVDCDFESPDYLGTCSPHIIRVLATQPLLTLLDTLVHEILHAIFTRNRMLKMALKCGMEENFIATLAAEVAHILLENELVKFPAKSPPITTRIVPEARP